MNRSRLFALALLPSLAVALTATLSGCTAASPDVTGSWGDTSDTTQPSLELAEDGSVTGTDGCNRLMGSYTAEGNEITFEAVASTMMFCQTVDTWLGQLSTATVDGNTMTVFDANDSEIGTLKR